MFGGPLRSFTEASRFETGRRRLPADPRRDRTVKNRGGEVRSGQNSLRRMDISPYAGPRGWSGLFLRLAVFVLGALFVSGVGFSASALAEGCSNETTRTGPSVLLPDCRAYEQVSPTQKDGWPVNLVRFVGDGESVVADSVGLFAGATGSKSNVAQFYHLLRGEADWDTVPIEDAPAGVLAYSGDEGEPTLISENGESLLYLRPADHSIYETDIYRHGGSGFVEVGPRLPASAVPAGPINEREQPNEGAEFIAATPDLSHVLFTIEPLNEELPPGVVSLLWPGDTTFLQTRGNSASLYEYVGAGNTTPVLVGLDNGGHLISDCGTFPGGSQGPTGMVRGNHHNTMSVDGQTVFFTARECGGGANGPLVDELFARVGGSHTVALSEPQALSPAPANDGCSSAGCVEHTSLADEATYFRAANFDGASADGSKVFFTSAQQLLNGAVQDPGNGSNLYEYDFDRPEGERLVLISAGDSSGLGPGVQGVAMVSEDGSHAYFVAKGVLTREPRGGATGRCLAELTGPLKVEEESTEEGLCRAKEGADNLYVYDAHGERTRYVASLSSSDAGEWRADGRKAIDVTNDGRFAVFTSFAHLTADDTAGARQVFRYDTDSGTLVRASSGEEGYNNNGNAASGETEIPRGESEPASLEEIAHDLHPAVSEEGGVVFTSSVALVPGARNNECALVEEGECKAKVQNVYEYESGHIYLISYGGAEGKAAINASGTDIYFQSAEQLVASDADTLPDIYDARVGGGFPVPAASTSCSGGCKAESMVAPVVAPPGSVTFSGPGNPLAAFTPVGGVVKKETAAEVRAEELKRALKACRKAHGARTGKRKSCETLAHRQFGPKGKPKAKKTNETPRRGR